MKNTIDGNYDRLIQARRSSFAFVSWRLYRSDLYSNLLTSGDFSDTVSDPWTKYAPLYATPNAPQKIESKADAKKEPAPQIPHGGAGVMPEPVPLVLEQKV
jgi:hypothetical protein